MRCIKCVLFVLLQVLLITSPLHFLFLSTVTVVYSATTGVQFKSVPTFLRTDNSIMQLAADYEFGPFQRNSTHIVFESNPPTYVLNWPYSYASATSKITVTGTEAANRTITFDYTAWPNTLRIYGVSSGYLTDVSYVAGNSTMRISVTGSGVGALQIYLGSCDGLYALQFPNGTVTGVSPYYDAVSKVASIPVDMWSFTASLFTPVISSVSRTVPSTWNMGQPSTFTLGFYNNAAYALAGLKVRFQLLDGATVKQDYTTGTFTATALSANSQSFSVVPTGIGETKTYTLRLSLIKNSPEWTIASWDHTVTVQGLGDVAPPPVTLPRLIVPIVPRMTMYAGESRTFNVTVQLEQSGPARFSVGDADGVPSSWIRIRAPTQITVSISAQLEVSLVIPSDAFLGNYDIVIPVVASVDAGSSREVVKFTVVVEPKPVEPWSWKWPSWLTWPKISLLEFKLPEIPPIVIFILVGAVAAVIVVYVATGERKPRSHKYYHR